MQLRENLAQWATTPFESSYHMQVAILDPQYSKIPEYRAAVEAKIILSSNTGTSSTVYNSIEREDSEVSAGLGDSATTATAERKEQQRTAEQIMLDTYGSLSLSPAQRARLNPPEPKPQEGYGFQPRED
jgi:hypothetical protein